MERLVPAEWRALGEEGVLLFVAFLFCVFFLFGGRSEAAAAGGFVQNKAKRA